MSKICVEIIPDKGSYVIAYLNVDLQFYSFWYRTKKVGDLGHWRFKHLLTNYEIRDYRDGSQLKLF